MWIVYLMGYGLVVVLTFLFVFDVMNKIIEDEEDDDFWMHHYPD